MEETDLIVLWGSNAREAHPIFFHHVLKAVHRGAKLMVIAIAALERGTLQLTPQPGAGVTTGA